MSQYPALSRLDLRRNLIKTDGVESFAGVLTQCPPLGHLHLSRNGIDTVMKGRLRPEWCGEDSDLVWENYEFADEDEDKEEDEEGRWWTRRSRNKVCKMVPSLSRLVRSDCH